MANLATLKAALNAAVYQNNQNAITGESLNTILTKIIDTLGAGYRYAGVATPSANPGTIDNRVFYLATAAGAYTNFGGTVLDGKNLHIFIYDTAWHNITLDVPTTAALAVVAGGNTYSIKGKGDNIISDGVGSLAFGASKSSTYAIVADADGTLAFGVITNDGEIRATGDGSQAKGYAETEEGAGVDAIILAEEQGAHASGFVYADTEDSSVQAIDAGSHAEGSANNGIISAEGIGSHAEGSANYGIIRADGEGAHAEGYTDGNNISASGDGSHAEGGGTTAVGVYSHAEGYETIAQNRCEHAEGRHNASHKKTTGTADEKAAGTTLSSIGCGTGDNDRKNAVEVMQNGDAYLKGVGGYDGTNPASQNVGSLEVILNSLIFFVSPQSALNVPIDNLRNWRNQPNVVSGSGYAYTALLDYEKRVSIYEQYLQSFLQTWIPSADLGNCVFIGVDGSAIFNSNGFLRGRFCCIYYDASSDNYYFIEMDR